MTEAAKMTEKSKTVTLERRAGDLTALYCMHDWMIALVLAVIAILTVWAGLIIYEYIQTIRGKRRKVDVVDTIRETEKDEKANTNEEHECVASTEESQVVTLKSWEEDGWRKEPMEWMPSKNGNEQLIEEYPTNNEDEEPIGEIPATNEDVEQILTNPTITNEDVGGIVEILTMPNADHLCGTQKQLLECPGDYSTVCSNENLTDILTDTDLQEPCDLFDMKTKETENQLAHFCDVETGHLKHPDIVMTSHVAAKVFGDMDLTEALPKHRCEGEMAGVKSPRVMAGPDALAEGAPEEMPAMTLTINDVDKHLPDLCDTEKEEIKYPDMTTCVVFANKPQDEKLEMSFSDTGLQSDMECENYNRRSHFANALEARNLPELGSTGKLKGLEPLLNLEEVKCLDHAYFPVASDDTGKEEPVYVVETEEDGVKCQYDEQINQNAEHLGKNVFESDPDLQENHNVCQEETLEVEVIGANTDTIVEGAIEDVIEGKPAEMSSDRDLQEPDNVCEAVMAEASCPVPRLDVTTPVGFAIKPQEGSRDGTLLDAEHRPGMKIEDLECPEARHGKVISEMASVYDDKMIGCVAEGLMEARDGDVVSKKEMEREVEESYEKVEINIMEATMDCNEWMAASGADTEEPTNSTEYLGEKKQHQLIDSPLDLADSSKVREARTTLEYLDGGQHGNKMAAAFPIKLETVTLRFCIHYHTHSPQQELAVTGNQPELGSWKGFVPLERGQDGFWVSSVLLPVERQVEWKFVLVEDGLIKRWEECVNRCLETGSGAEEVMLNKCWGCL